MTSKNCYNVIRFTWTKDFMLFMSHCLHLDEWCWDDVSPSCLMACIIFLCWSPLLIIQRDSFDVLNQSFHSFSTLKLHTSVEYIILYINIFIRIVSLDNGKRGKEGTGEERMYNIWYTYYVCTLWPQQEEIWTSVDQEIDKQEKYYNFVPWLFSFVKNIGLSMSTILAFVLHRFPP